MSSTLRASRHTVVIDGHGVNESTWVLGTWADGAEAQEACNRANQEARLVGTSSYRWVVKAH